VRRMVEELYDEVMTLLRENRDKLDRLAQALLQQETLDQSDAYAAAGIEPRGTGEQLVEIEATA